MILSVFTVFSESIQRNQRGTQFMRNIVHAPYGIKSFPSPTDKMPAFKSCLCYDILQPAGKEGLLAWVCGFAVDLR